jgi:carboxylate-amine ligase
MAIFTDSRASTDRQRAFSRGGSLPDWARWTTHPSRLYTLGVEDEVMLLDPTEWSLTQASDRVLEDVSPQLARSVRPETHAAVVELVTGVHTDVAGVVSEALALRQQLARELREFGLAAAAAGTHPAADWEETEVSSTPRYSVLEETMRTLVRREPTMALHVHVGVPDPHEAVVLLNAFRSILPILIALSANSPYSRRRDGGFACGRRMLFQAFPRTGTPRQFADYRDYVDAVDGLVTPGAVPDSSFLWWDVRLQPRLGTVEVRAMDAQSTVKHIAPLVALIQSFARLVLEGDFRGTPPGPEVAEENGFLAARDGMDALLIEPEARELVSARTLLDALVGDCRPHAAALGCAGALEGARRLAECNGAQCQRALLCPGEDFSGLVARLAEKFTEHDLSRVGLRPHATR